MSEGLSLEGSVSSLSQNSLKGSAHVTTKHVTYPLQGTSTPYPVLPYKYTNTVMFRLMLDDAPKKALHEKHIELGMTNCAQ